MNLFKSEPIDSVAKTNYIYAFYGIIIGAVLAATVYHQNTKDYVKVMNTKHVGKMVIVNGELYTLEEIRKCTTDC
jgi:hypothetical protein